MTSIFRVFALVMFIMTFIASIVFVISIGSTSTSLFPPGLHGRACAMGCLYHFSAVNSQGLHKMPQVFQISIRYFRSSGQKPGILHPEESKVVGTAVDKRLPVILQKHDVVVRFIEEEKGEGSALWKGDQKTADFRILWNSGANAASPFVVFIVEAAVIHPNEVFGFVIFRPFCLDSVVGHHTVTIHLEGDWIMMHIIPQSRVGPDIKASGDQVRDHVTRAATPAESSNQSDNIANDIHRQKVNNGQTLNF